MAPPMPTTSSAICDEQVASCCATAGLFRPGYQKNGGMETQKSSDILLGRRS